MRQVRPLKTFTISFVLPQELAFLEQLAYNFWWSWNREAEKLFALIDPERWEMIRRNPVRLLKETSQERFRQLLADEQYRRLLQRVEESFNAYLNTSPHDAWQYEGPIAYFCAEYGISECFQNYSGGLGVLAGDHLKTASDVGLPMVAIGLLYQQGYFHQEVTHDGWQRERFADYDFSQLPLQEVFDRDGAPLTVSVELPEGDVYARVWKAIVGKVPLYLLDTNIGLNDAILHYRTITSQLYAGTHETRIMQEMVLGIGGVRVLEKLGINPAVLHINEGHAAFCTLEWTRQLSRRYALEFHQALEITRAQTCFTTHTPVPAGNEIFSVGLMKKYFPRYHSLLGISWEEFLALGQVNHANEDEGFSMTILGLKMSSYRNGVSQLHASVARAMWQDLWKHVPLSEVPIIGITNGVHHLTWTSSDFADLYDRAIGPQWRTHPHNPAVWQPIMSVSDAELWAVHVRRRLRLLELVRSYMQSQRGYYDEQARERVLAALHPNCLLIGFARRFATYKRSDLLFRDWSRLAAILRNPSRPVVVLLAGKAHPQDIASKEMMQRILAGVRTAGLEQHVIFLEDYDLGVARVLVKGVDIWLDTPRRPYEASGTSGMKAALNGVLHCSVLDGWWAEAARGDNGFTIGKGETYPSADLQDARESESLYQLLENDIVPEFYERDAAGVPRRWVKRMKAAIVSCAAQYSTHRMLKEYYQLCYGPAAQLGKDLQRDHAQATRALYKWKQELPARWQTLSIEEVSLPDGHYSVGQPIRIQVRLDCGVLQPEELLVQAYYGPVSSEGIIAHGSLANLQCVHVDGTKALFEGSVIPSESGQHGITVRILPYHQHVPSPIDLRHVLWADNPT